MHKLRRFLVLKHSQNMVWINRNPHNVYNWFCLPSVFVQPTLVSILPIRQQHISQRPKLNHMCDSVELLYWNAFQSFIWQFGNWFLTTYTGNLELHIMQCPSTWMCVSMRHLTILISFTKNFISYPMHHSSPFCWNTVLWMMLCNWILQNTRIDIDLTSIRCESVGSMSNRCRCQGICHLGGHCYFPLTSMRNIL